MTTDTQQFWEIFHLIIDGQVARFEPIKLSDPQPNIVTGGDCQAVIYERHIEGGYILPYSAGLGHDILSDPLTLVDLLESNMLWFRESDLRALLAYLEACTDRSEDLDWLLTLLRDQVCLERFLADDVL